MTATQIDSGNVYVTSGTIDISTPDVIDTANGQHIVRIDQQKIDNTLTNELVEFNIPVAPGAKETDAPSGQLIDLKRIKHVLSLQGQLITDTTDDAFTKKRNIMVLAGYGGNDEDSLMAGQTLKSGAVIVVYGLEGQGSQHKLQGNIVKLMITETPGKQSDGTSDTKIDMAYSVQLQVAVGIERGDSQ